MIPAPVMQFCTAGQGFVERVTNFAFVEAVGCVYIEPIGFSLVGMMFWGAVAIPSYLMTGSIVIPVVLLLLVGGAIVTQLAAPAVSLAAIALLFAGAGVLTYLYWRFAR